MFASRYFLRFQRTFQVFRDNGGLLSAFEFSEAIMVRLNDNGSKFSIAQFFPWWLSSGSINASSVWCTRLHELYNCASTIGIVTLKKSFCFSRSEDICNYVLKKTLNNKFICCYITCNDFSTKHVLFSTKSNRETVIRHTIKTCTESKQCDHEMIIIGNQTTQTLTNWISFCYKVLRKS